MGCCPSQTRDSLDKLPDDEPMIKDNNISKASDLINSVEKSQPLLSGADHLAFQNVVDLSSSSSIDQNVLEDLMKSSSSDDSDLEEEDDE